jgi:hypothetical protein
MNKIICFLSLTIMSAGLMAADSQPGLLIKAQDVPPRASTGCHSSWNCGPDTIARFFVLSGLKEKFTDDDYIKITTQCPRSCGKPVTNKGYAAVTCLGGISASCFYAGAYDYGLLGLLSGALALAPFAIEAYNASKGIGNVGPTPHWLIEYANGIIDAHKWHAHLAYKQFASEEDMLKFVKKELKDKPVIVLVNYAPLAWHYFSITDYEQNNDIFKCLDGRSTYDLKCDDLVEQMDFDKSNTIKYIKTALQYVGPILSVDIGRFNVIYLDKFYQ